MILKWGCQSNGRTPDFLSGNPSSILGIPTFCGKAQMEEQPAVNRKDASSTLAAAA